MLAQSGNARRTSTFASETRSWLLSALARKVFAHRSAARIDSAFAGRAYAAYGGIYIAASLVWPWVAEDQTPTRTDLVGALLAVIGALVIITFAAPAR
jgi:small multidrug resistance family-3 protein